MNIIRGSFGLAPGSNFLGLARTPVHSAPVMGVASATVLAANTSRKAASFQNIGTVDVYINLTGVGVVSTGILLPANGGGYNMSDALGNLMTGIIRGISSSGTPTVLVTEYT